MPQAQAVEPRVVVTAGVTWQQPGQEAAVATMQRKEGEVWGPAIALTGCTLTAPGRSRVPSPARTETGFTLWEAALRWWEGDLLPGATLPTRLPAPLLASEQGWEP